MIKSASNQFDSGAQPGQKLWKNQCGLMNIDLTETNVNVLIKTSYAITDFHTFYSALSIDEEND